MELDIERIVAGGDALARLDGEAIFVERGAPGDRALVRITEERRNFRRGVIKRVISPSPDRVEPRCPLYDRCGGCSLQHIAYGRQLEIKRGIVEELFRRFAKLSSIPPIRVVASPEPFGYRNRMQFHRVAGPDARVSRVGLKHRDGQAIVPVTDCPVADKGIRAALASGSLLPPPASDRFNVYACKDTFLAEGEKERGSVAILDRALALDVRGFFQSNAAALECLLTDAIALSESADRGKRFLDLYCGVGTFAAFLAPYFPGADLVEREKTSIALARQNVREGNPEFYALSDDQWAARKQSGPYGMAVVDPPRTGLSIAVRDWLCAKKIPLLLYVSCDPATLARDTAFLAGSGYALESLTLYDFYPQTAHVESLAVFRGPA